VTVLIALGSMVIAVVLGLPLGRRTMERAVMAARGVYVLRRVLSRHAVLVQLLFSYFGLPVIGSPMPGWLTALVDSA
jgi:ABC-type amino acid transport system permease subunit